MVGGESYLSYFMYAQNSQSLMASASKHRSKPKGSHFLGYFLEKSLLLSSIVMLTRNCKKETLVEGFNNEANKRYLKHNSVLSEKMNL